MQENNLQEHDSSSGQHVLVLVRVRVHVPTLSPHPDAQGQVQGLKKHGYTQEVISSWKVFDHPPLLALCHIVIDGLISTAATLKLCV